MSEDNDHVLDALNKIVDRADEIAADSAAVQTVTREAIIADNVKFRRRNGILVSLVVILLIGVGVMVYRDIYVNAPEREKISQQTKGLQDANEKLDNIEDFIVEVQNNDGDGVTRQELEVVFEAVFDTKQMVECVLKAPDDAAARECVNV